MKLIVISGESGLGKTKLAEGLLAQLKNWSAIKLTTIKENNCPQGKLSCGICYNFRADYELIENSSLIEQKGKDTARLKKAGAKKVIWLKAKPRGLKRGIEKALEKLKDSKGVIIEGRSILRYIKPDVVIHLKKDGKKEIKFFSSDKELLKLIMRV